MGKIALSVKGHQPRHALNISGGTSFAALV